MTKQWMDKELMVTALTKYTAVELAKKWKCDKRTIHMWAKRHGIALHKFWPVGDLEYLKKNAMHKSYTVIAKRLRRSADSVRNMAQSLGLSVFDHISDYTLLSDLSREFGVDMPIMHHFMMRHKLPVKKLRSHAKGSLHYIDVKEVDEWLRAGHILRLDRKNLSQRLQRMHDEVRAQYFSQSELTAIDPWLGGYSIRCQRKRGAIPKPFMTGSRHSSRESYYLKVDIYAHYFTYGDTIPANIHCDWIDAIRESWQSMYIYANDVYKIIPRSTCHQYHRIKNFPSCLYTSYYDRGELVEWLTDYGWHDKARLIKSDPITYQELLAYRSQPRYTYRDSSWQ
jgi:hypothetical protein